MVRAEHCKENIFLTAIKSSLVDTVLHVIGLNPLNVISFYLSKENQVEYTGVGLHISDPVIHRYHCVLFNLIRL